MGDKKRAEPEPVEPVVIGGVRYEAPFSGAEADIPQDGGVVVAIESATGRLLWAVLVYKTEYDPDMEDDKQDVFIKMMLPGADGKTLIIVNELGDEYRLDIETRAVTPVKINPR